MIQATKGILLKTVKHSDSSAVIHVYTHKFGRRAYFLRGLSKKKNSPRAFLFPLSLLDLQVSERESKSLQYIKEISLSTPLHSLISNPAKSSVALFITEILEKCIVENYQNSELFEFISNSVEILEELQSCENFHIWFLLNMSKFLGFHPTNSNEFLEKQEVYFRLDNGSFQRTRPILEPYLDPEISRILIDILGMKFDEVMSLKMNSEKRRNLLRGMVNYYKIHIDHLNHIASLDVLETVFEV